MTKPKIDIQQWLTASTQLLKDAGIDTARLDSLLLLEDALQQNRAYILAHTEQLLTAPQHALLNKKVMQRSSHLPLAYARNMCHFYGRQFYVDQHVLVPRPETETLVTCALELPLATRARIADIGTGSGCIGITLALERPNFNVELYDIDRNALAVAQKNANRLQTSVTVHHGDLLLPLQGTYDLLVANLPYVPTHLPINKAATFEPPGALFAGDDGLDAYRRLCDQLRTGQTTPLYIVTEALPAQHLKLKHMFSDTGYVQLQAHDFIQVFRRSR